MKLFSKTNKDNTGQKPNTLSQMIQKGYTRLQRGWASWMGKHTERFSRRTWMLLLVLFVLSTGTCCVYLAVSAFTGKAGNSIFITPIKKLKHVNKTGETDLKAAEISKAEYIRIRRFRVYMDSLARSPSGKLLYDSIISHRPGLMDSVRFIENYYQQLKRK